ncbi:ECF-type sigma factor [Chiayiivirga flava]|uniref:RNA polymerase sigma factor (TIGR02999 family) n=1 Tax=Chiayiivirga flava TaxID=659595 RepID=A0A7W8DB85_9GAMM|nr:ECF-type sigma factor [Chiayiivirga flava]MBB5209523.1 RNA polymerase sigma factor (TIGR02999 family) [Chiayiivirga flava]
MHTPDDAPITTLLAAWRGGDDRARDRLAAALYPELRRLAQQAFRRERRDHTLQPTALVNEAWLRLAGSASIPGDDRGHLLSVAARLMREILIDHARRRAAAKRDGGARVTLSRVEVGDDGDGIDLLGLDAALQRLDRIDPVKGRIVELRYFGGLSIEDTARALSLSPATIKRHWQAARVWLFDALAGEADPAR